MHVLKPRCMLARNWGLTDHELTTIPPSLVRGFMKSGRGGFGSELPSSFGRLLMRDQYNSELYGPLQILYEEGKAAGTDVWIHKNRCVRRGAIAALLLTIMQNERALGAPECPGPVPSG